MITNFKIFEQIDCFGLKKGDVVVFTNGEHHIPKYNLYDGGGTILNYGERYIINSVLWCDDFSERNKILNNSYFITLKDLNNNIIYFRKNIPLTLPPDRFVTEETYKKIEFEKNIKNFNL